MSNLDMQKYSLSEDDWVLLSGAYKHLKLFKYVSKTLSGEKYISLPLVIIDFNLLLDQIDKAVREIDANPSWSFNDLKIRDVLVAAHEKLLKHYRKCN